MITHGIIRSSMRPPLVINEIKDGEAHHAVKHDKPSRYSTVHASLLLKQFLQLSAAYFVIDQREEDKSYNH